MKKLILLLLLLPVVSAVTFENQTEIHESDTSGAGIQLWQDTVADQWHANETYGGISITNLATFNSTFINLNGASGSKIQFIDMDDVTVYYSNGTTVSFTGTDFVLEITIPAGESITLATDVPPVEASTSIVIKPDYTDTVPHIVLGRRLIFTWLSFLL